MKRKDLVWLLLALFFASCAESSDKSNIAAQNIPQGQSGDAVDALTIVEQSDIRVPSSDASLPRFSEAMRCDVQNEMVSLKTWQQAADAIFIGRIAEVTPGNDYGYCPDCRRNPDGRTVLRAEECERISSSLMIKLDPKAFSVGMAIEGRPIRLGAMMGDCYDAFDVPHTSGTEVRWRNEKNYRLEPGMIIGGALYYLEEYDFFHIHLDWAQPLFQVDSNERIRFHGPGRTCPVFLPPMEQLNGVSVVDLVQMLLQTEQEIDRSHPNDNPMRELFGRHHDVQFGNNLSWFGRCTPKIEPPPYYHECLQDSDCGDHRCVDGFCFDGFEADQD